MKDQREPKVCVESSCWHKENGLRLVVHSLHDGFKNGNMYSVAHARILALKLNEACDEVENENRFCKEAFLNLGKKLGFI
jgi:hypothetical protein